MSTPYREEANLGVLRHIGNGETILDVGCGRGQLGEAMKARGNVVHGIELDKDAAAVAKTRLDAVHTGDVMDFDALPARIAKTQYDTIVCADVLEHTVAPDRLLRALRRLLRPGGRMIASLPNVASWPIRTRLLLGNFTYGDSGVLDRTHLRFFTRKTAKDLLREAGFAIEAEDVTPYFVRAALPLISKVMPQNGNPRALADSSPYRFYANYVEPLEARVARLWPEMCAFQIVLVGRDRRAAATQAEERTVVAMITRNEEAAVDEVMREIRRAAPGANVLIVDSSTDRTAERAEAHGATVIRQLPPKGYGPAMRAALEAAANLGDVVITLDCDGTYPTEVIPELARLVREDGWDIVNATRLADRPAAMPLPNWLANGLFALTTRAIHGLDVTDVHSGMRAYRSELLRQVPFFAEAPALPVELLIKPARLGYRVKEIPIGYRERIGETTLRRFESTVWTFRRIFGLLGTGSRVRA